MLTSAQVRHLLYRVGVNPASDRRHRRPAEEPGLGFKLAVIRLRSVNQRDGRRVRRRPHA